jgi:D-apionolactonase
VSWIDFSSNWYNHQVIKLLDGLKTIDRNVITYGTTEPAQVLRPVRLGPLSFLYSPEGIRRVCWRGTELVRAITWPIRDENWGTYPLVVLDEQIHEDKNSVKGQLRFSVAGGQLECLLNFQGTSAGELNLELTMTPDAGGFATNRAGLTILHPIKGLTGAALDVTHSSGKAETTDFPKLISAGQPVFDIQGLTYSLDGQSVDIGFSGEIFEMEDQRNWSDASYKTYCVPLVPPFVYRFSSPVKQGLSISFSGGAESNGQSRQNVMIELLDEVAPDIGFVIEPGWIDSQHFVEQIGVSHLCARVAPDQPDQYLNQLADVLAGRQLDVELLIADDADPREALEAAQIRLEQAGLVPDRVIALREAYLGSHQPTGPWPNGATPAEVVALSRAVFSDADIGGGMLTNFTEMNRCHPQPEICDFITHGNTAIVHAGDDLSVCETLETLPQVFETAQSIADGKPYRLGLVSIGMRSNPYGAAVAENPGQIRRTMAREDPRQRGLFAAAWAVGVLAGTEQQAIQSMCLAAPTGPFGVAYAKQTYPQAFFDTSPKAAFYPLYHVVKTAASMSGGQRLQITNLPDGVFAYGVKTDDGARMMFANVTASAQTIVLPTPKQVAILDEHAFGDATRLENWLDVALRPTLTTLNLGAFAVAFADG